MCVNQMNNILVGLGLIEIYIENKNMDKDRITIIVNL